MPTGDVLNYLYYGSGHLHHINLNGETLTDIERDNLHRPIVRSAGGLNTRFQFDPMGRLKQQISQLAQYDSSNQSALIGRQYHYDATGNLIRTDGQRNGNIDYAYDSLGRILQAADERFAFDPAHNISDDAQIIKGNRLAEYNGVRYRYDGLGNLTERHSHTESQFYRYDADNQLIEARIEKATVPTQYWQYHYDPFGRRISKTNAKTQQSTLFVWEGSRLLQEHQADKVYTYVYTEQNSYEPLAQIEAFRQPEKLNTPIIRYFHTDQIGIPREMTDEAGNIVWRGQYSGWGKLLHEEKANNHIHQPFRLQNQYADEETGLHYNFFRYYDAHCGRFTQQDPIKLVGGENLYAFAPNAQQWVDPLGLEIVAVYNKRLNYLFLHNKTTGKVMLSTFVKSGNGYNFDEKIFGGPIPTGKYDILEHGKKSDQYFRLESLDNSYGDDKDQRTGRDKFRLHYPGSGRSDGCISSTNDEDWNAINQFIKDTQTSTVKVDKKSFWLDHRLPDFLKKESIKKYGTLIVN